MKKIILTLFASSMLTTPALAADLYYEVRPW